MSNDKKSLIQQVETIETDFETGEIKSKKTNRTFTMPKQPDYVKLYLRDILYLSDLQTSQSGLLYELLMRISWQTRQIVLNSHVKKEIASSLNISIGTIDNNLNRFVKGKLLERVGRGVYMPNPYLFGFGEWADIFQDRENNIQLNVNYSENGRTFQAEIVKATENEKLKKENEQKNEKDCSNDNQEIQEMSKVV